MGAHSIIGAKVRPSPQTLRDLPLYSYILSARGPRPIRTLQITDGCTSQNENVQLFRIETISHRTVHIIGTRAPYQPSAKAIV